MSIPIDAVVFDYGNVLSRPQDAGHVASMATLASVTVAEFRERYWRERLGYDRGDLSAGEYWAGVLGSGASAGDARVESMVEHDAASWIGLDGRMVGWARSLRASGVPIAILSNMPREVADAVRATRRAWLEEFAAVVFSYEERSVKPEARIYRRLLDVMQLPGGRVLFIDDREANVEGAARLGMQTIHYTMFEALRATVETRYVCRAPARPV